MKQEKTIGFFFEVDFKFLNKRKITKWIKESLHLLSIASFEINYIFCDDVYLLKINQKYLNHDTYTDIITFDYSEEKEDKLQADAYISLSRIKENARKFTKENNEQEELKRVMIHAVLHLVGYKDKTIEEKKTMRAKEDFFIHLYDNL